MRKIIALLLLATLISGCVMPQKKVETWQMQSTLQYRGFSIKRPEDNRWYLYPGEQYEMESMWRMDNPSPTHSVYVTVNLQRLPSPINSVEELDVIMREDATAESQRLKLLEFESTQGTYQGQWCVYIDRTMRDLAPLYHDKPLVLKETGFVVRHPSWPDIVLCAWVSQRGKAEEISPEIDEAGKALLNGVILEATPGKRVSPPDS